MITPLNSGGNLTIDVPADVAQDGDGAALAQLTERGYADKYRSLDQPIHLVGGPPSPTGNCC